MLDTASFFDHTRDLFCIVNHFRNEMPRPLVGLGHSLGGTVIINLALLHPRLLTTVIAVEPGIHKSPRDLNASSLYPITFTSDLWPSRSEAIEAIQQKGSLQNLAPCRPRQLPACLPS